MDHNEQFIRAMLNLWASFDCTQTTCKECFASRTLSDGVPICTALTRLYNEIGGMQSDGSKGKE